MWTNHWNCFNTTIFRGVWISAPSNRMLSSISESVSFKMWQKYSIHFNCIMVGFFFFFFFFFKWSQKRWTSSPFRETWTNRPKNANSPPWENQATGRVPVPVQYGAHFSSFAHRLWHGNVKQLRLVRFKRPLLEITYRPYPQRWAPVTCQWTVATNFIPSYQLDSIFVVRYHLKVKWIELIEQRRVYGGS